ncbi:MAG: response regulator transcription factor [Nocardioides sp.]|nr:response regulator transcription factor [Nocardioides sp.]
MLRAGLTVLLGRGGYQVVAAAGDADELLASATDTLPRVVVTDARLRHDLPDEGVTAALRLHEKVPDLGILVLAESVDTAYAARLFGSTGTGGLGYLLKERVRDVAHFLDVVGRVATGEVVLDPDVVRSMVGRPHDPAVISALSLRELEILHMMATGLPDRTIAGRLFIKEAELLAHVGEIFLKLGLPTEVEARRRPAPLTHLRPAG